MDRERARVIFSGVVQGVFFRANTQKIARLEGVDGWVRNLPDGRVEAVFEGPGHKVELVIDWCRNKQPHARVTGAEVEYSEPEGERGFEIRY